jgi:hypothetical protein
MYRRIKYIGPSLAQDDKLIYGTNLRDAFWTRSGWRTLRYFFFEMRPSILLARSSENPNLALAFE